MKGYYLTILFLCLTVGEGVHGNNAAWISPTGDVWNTDGNWTAPHPDATDAIAGFVGFPTSAGTITSTSNISVGSLVFNTTTSVNLNLGHNLTLSASGNASIFVSGTSSSTITGLTPLILDSSVDIFISNQVNLSIQSSISGAGALNLYGSSNGDRLFLSGNNTYLGGTFVKSNILELNGAPDVTNIPGDIEVSALGTVFHLNKNHYSPTTSMTINGGFVDINVTHQIMKKLIVTRGGIFISSSGGILDLLATPGDAALTIGSAAQVMPSLINIVNGGGIFYDLSSPGTAFLPGPMTIDLQGNSVDLHVQHNPFNCVDIDSGETVFQNGILNKTGDGEVRFQGGAVPTFNIEEGTVIIGDPNSSEVVTATGLVTIFSPAVLGGFQTLAAQMGVVNSGTIRPGDACKGCSTVGTLTIIGDHAQTVSGTLAIKALNPATSDLLVVDGGQVTLNGELNFDALPGAVFKAGDQIVVINNPNENTPITGRFSSFVYNLPPCLQATIVYNPHQVLVEITNCPCPTPAPPSNFIGKIKKCKFLNKTKCFLEATWTASPSEDVIFYRIYKDGFIINTVLATSPLIFVDSNLKDCSIAGFEVAAVNSDNFESIHVKLRRVHDLSL